MTCHVTNAPPETTYIYIYIYIFVFWRLPVQPAAVGDPMRPHAAGVKTKKKRPPDKHSAGAQCPSATVLEALALVVLGTLIYARLVRSFVGGVRDIGVIGYLGILAVAARTPKQWRRQRQHELPTSSIGVCHVKTGVFVVKINIA